MARAKLLPVRTLPEVIIAHPTHRQSLLGTVDSCALMARMELEGVAFDNAAQARGILFHRTAAEILKTLWGTGNQTIPTEEAMQIMYEVCAQRDLPDEDVVWLPSVEQRMLRKCVLFLVWDPVKRRPRPFNVSMIMNGPDGPTIETRLYAKVRYPESVECPSCAHLPRVRRSDRGTSMTELGDVCGECGGSRRVLTGAMVERIVTGQPDAMLADGDDASGVRVLDWKTTRQPPPKGDDGDHHDDAEHVSYMGYFQQQVYALLIFANYPGVERVQLREFYPLAGESRYATIYRKDLEHVVHRISVLCELLDRALMGGHKSALWKPQPGKHCAYCPRPTQCPIEADVRAFNNGGIGGGVATKAMASKLAGEFVVADRVRTAILKALKPWVDTHGPLDVKDGKGRSQLRWRNNKTGGGRTFGLYVPDDSDRGPRDKDLNLTEAFAAVADRKKSA